MRLYFTLSPNTEPVPFDYQHRLTGVFHKWLKDNSLHDRISLYSLSWIDGSFARNGSLYFPNGAKWFVSFYEEEYVERLVNGALSSGWKTYIETLRKLYDELSKSSEKDKSKPFCESCGDRPATDVLDSVGCDFFPLAGSLGNDAQALPAASRAPRICGLCLIAVQWLPLGAMIFGGKLACFQFTEAKLSQFVVEKIYRENKSLLDVTKVSEKTASYGAGKGATPVALLLLETMRKLHSDRKKENLPRGTSLSIWAFST